MFDPVFGAFLLVFGVPFALFPYRLARFEEQLDSIGSKTPWSAVEPAGWKVGLTRIGGITMATLGAISVLAAVV